MKILYKNKHWKIQEDYNLDKILYLLIDRPNRINYNNNFIWENEKNIDHKNYDLPAYVCSDGYVDWYKKAKFHRENNKPARIWWVGCKEYWINGEVLEFN